MSGITTCPRCRSDLRGAHHIQGKTLVCPHCHAPLGSSSLDLPDIEVSDRDIRQGMGRGYWTVLALIVPVVLGIAVICVTLPRGRALDLRGQLLIEAFIVLDLLVFTAIIWPLYRYMAVPTPEEVRIGFGFVLVFFGTAFAVVVVFWQVCAVFIDP